MTAREVVLEGGAPWGFRMHGGVDVQQPLRISRVNPGSKSSVKGIREGEVILSINNRSTSEVTNLEAHGLLKNSGNTLVLSLNKVPQATTKKRLISSTTQTQTAEDSTNENTLTTINRNASETNDVTHQFLPIKINGVSENRENFENVVASQASTLSSNYSSSLSTASLYSDISGIGICYSSVRDKPAARKCDCQTAILPDNGNDALLVNMPDKHEGGSRSNCKKRTRMNNTNDASSELHNEMKQSTNDRDAILEQFQTLEYRVDSPETVSNKKPKLGQVAQSKSLEDSDNDVVITEIHEPLINEHDKQDCAVEGAAGVLSKKEVAGDDEQILRQHTGGLNLLSGESYKERKARTRAALAEHFFPILQQPRFLDVINEECSDSSNSGEHPNEKVRKKRSCVGTKREIVQVRGSKLSEAKNVQGVTFSSIVAERPANAEVVFLNGSSPSGSESSSDDELDVLKLAAMANQLTPPTTPDEDDKLTFTALCHEPKTLRTICINKLLLLPFGHDIFEELSSISQTIQNTTETWHDKYLSNLKTLQESEISNESNNHRLLTIIHEFKDIHTENHVISNNTPHSLSQHTPFSNKPNLRKRLSLPQEFFERQFEQIREKERQLQNEIEKLESDKRKLLNEMNPHSKEFDLTIYSISKNGDYAEHNDELFRQKMYDEYMEKIAALHERKLHKIIKITSPQPIVGSTETLCPIIHPSGIENEFMCKVHERKQKLGLDLVENRELSPPKVDERTSVLVIDGNFVKDGKELPKHLREFVELTERAADASEEDELTHGIWSPGHKDPETRTNHYDNKLVQKDDPVPLVWAPRSAGSSPTTERKEFKSVKFDSPKLERKTPVASTIYSEVKLSEPPWQVASGSRESGVAVSKFLEKGLPTSRSAPASGFIEYTAPRLPKAQNPTITLLQKAREGQLTKTAPHTQHPETYHSSRRYPDRPPLRGPADVLYQVKNEYTSELDGSQNRRKMADLTQRQYEIEIGPTGDDGMPLGLRSEVKDANQSKWYKKMYDTIHKQKPDPRYPYVSGYFSEPENTPSNFSAYYYDSDAGSTSDNKYTTLDRRRVQPSDSRFYVSDHHMSSTLPRPRDRDNIHSDIIKHGQESYRNHPGRIENYMPGHSSISDKEAKQWWDEVMDIFDGHLDQQKPTQLHSKSFINQALKESGYESDSNLIFKRREEAMQQLSPTEQREAYKTIQKGGDVPLQGLRKPAPERPKESEAPTPPPKGHQGFHFYDSETPRKYVENEVTIHYKTPVRQEVKESLSEEELSRRQAEHMKRVYEEERRRKYLQVSDSVNNELQDINNRRHTDNFTPSQKSPISLNRYDDFPTEEPPKIKQRPKSPEPRLIAKAVYNFVGQSARELTFRKGDIIYIRRQVDKNWYEGEFNAMIGLFPSNYVEIIPFDGAKSTPRKPYEGQARAKFNFIAQTNLELSLAKGELVVIIRKVDDNWYEGRIGGRKGIFPISYVEVLIDPATPPPTHGNNKPVSSPAAHSLLLNGSLGGKESMGSHSYVPSIPHQQQLPLSYRSKPQQMNGTGSLSKSMVNIKNPVSQALHIDTHLEPIPYRALYKYCPQNEDELELMEGDVVYVLEKCDDGWYVGSSQRTGAFGTFPGNYVDKV